MPMPCRTLSQQLARATIPLPSSMPKPKANQDPENVQNGKPREINPVDNRLQHTHPTPNPLPLPILKQALSPATIHMPLVSHPMCKSIRLQWMCSIQLVSLVHSRLMVQVMVIQSISFLVTFT
jgi:hypothetical protein